MGRTVLLFFFFFEEILKRWRRPRRPPQKNQLKRPPFRSTLPQKFCESGKFLRKKALRPSSKFRPGWGGLRVGNLNWPSKPRSPPSLAKPGHFLRKTESRPGPDQALAVEPGHFKVPHRNPFFTSHFSRPNGPKMAKKALFCRFGQDPYPCANRDFPKTGPQNSPLRDGDYEKWVSFERPFSPRSTAAAERGATLGHAASPKPSIPRVV